jgi:hypothetical protein
MSPDMVVGLVIIGFIVGILAGTFMAQIWHTP